MNWHGRFDWSDSAIADLKRLHADGLSASQIAAELGCPSRNSVIGKVSRLGLLRPTKARSTPFRKPRPKLRTFNQMLQDKAKAEQVREARVEREQAKAVDAALATELPPDQSDCAIPFLTATDETCRWPITEPAHDMLICGAKVTSKPYCVRHARIAFAGKPGRR